MVFNILDESDYIFHHPVIFRNDFEFCVVVESTYFFYRFLREGVRDFESSLNRLVEVPFRRYIR